MKHSSKISKVESELLYPRLELKPGYESWAVIEQLIASPLNKLSDRSLVSDLDVMLEWGNIGGKASMEHCSILADGLVKIAEKHGFPHLPNNNQKRAADAEMAAFLHENMRISRNEAAHEGVWNAMSCYFCPVVVGWRWSNGDEEGNDGLHVDEEDEVEKTSVSERWFTQSKSERHALGRLWWRAELLKDNDAKDPYWIISSLMEDEQVQCTERGLFVTHREAVICLAKKHLSELKSDGPRMLIFRRAIKNLRRMAAVTDLDTATEAHQLQSMVDSCYSEAVADFI